MSCTGIVDSLGGNQTKTAFRAQKIILSVWMKRYLEAEKLEVLFYSIS
jgi:hypothetical protein